MEQWKDQNWQIRLQNQKPEKITEQQIEEFKNKNQEIDNCCVMLKREGQDWWRPIEIQTTWTKSHKHRETSTMNS
jgi:hypothetical protein